VPWGGYAVVRGPSPNGREVVKKKKSQIGTKKGRKEKGKRVEVLLLFLGKDNSTAPLTQKGKPARKKTPGLRRKSAVLGETFCVRPIQTLV